jgi:hypothetical protein
VNRDRRLAARVQDPMDRYRGHDERGPRSELARLGLAPERQPVLANMTRDDGDRGGGVIMIVKPGVLVLTPADDPRVDLVIVPDLLIDTDVVRVVHEVAPALRGSCEARSEVPQRSVVRLMNIKSIKFVKLVLNVSALP